ncbi:unnamed protein product [Mytilus edulis]|uniref:Uncharacterized protein n=1 Tax=Mytilus edulis TaxID=6550 RepID=A0A8S3QIK5_MYTED|nr:unnamed protein product [Mytilus edulis]
MAAIHQSQPTVTRQPSVTPTVSFTMSNLQMSTKTLTNTGGRSSAHSTIQVTTLPVSNEDNVYQALKMKDSTDLSADVAQMLGEIEMKEIAKESVGTVVSVARYGQENIKLFNLLVKKFQQKNGTFKSIPQALFKELQGIKDLKRTSFLQEALDTSLKILPQNEGKLTEKNLQEVNDLNILKVKSVTSDASAQLSKVVREFGKKSGNSIRREEHDYCHTVSDNLINPVSNIAGDRGDEDVKLVYDRTDILPDNLANTSKCL